MKNAILNAACLIAMAGCEAEAPVPSMADRAGINESVVTAEKTLENSGNAAEAPACRRDETRIYACDFGVRRVAVCAAETRLSYRFGTDHRTDLEIDSRPGQVRAYTGGVVGGGNGHQNRIRFTNNGYQYIVHSMTAGDLTDAPGVRSSGVTVIRGTGMQAPVVQDLTCPQDTAAQVISGVEALPEGTFDQDGEAYDGWW